MVVSDWSRKDSLLSIEIVEALDEFIAEPSQEEVKGAAVIKSYEDWHEFLLQPEIHDLMMTVADQKLMKKSTAMLSAAHARYREEVRRRIADQDFAGNDGIYDEIHRLQTLNPLAD